MSHLTSTLIGMAAMFLCGWTTRGMVENLRLRRDSVEELKAEVIRIEPPFRALPKDMAAEVQRLEQEHPR